MTAPVPADANPVDADPVTAPSVTRRPVPPWITDPNLIESIALGFMTIDDFTGDAS